jgi:hypothetical protein
VSHFATRAIVLEGSGGTISAPPSRLASIVALDGSDISWVCDATGQGGAGSALLQDEEPFVSGDIVVTGTPGTAVAAHLRF